MNGVRIARANMLQYVWLRLFVLREDLLTDLVMFAIYLLFGHCEQIVYL